jgi:hypothetical protein
MRLLSFRRHPRGAAAVEMSICMLVIVPVFLYALFLDDLLRYSLDAQEAALSTAWDFAVQDYSRSLVKTEGASKPPGGLTVVQNQARLMFCDHESGIDSYQLGSYTDENGAPVSKYRDCEETGHHQALAAHICWINDNARQVTCEETDTSAAQLGDALHTSFQNKFTRGGLIRCSARAVVENYLLPKRFLQEFSKQDLTKNQWKGTGQAIHNNSKQGDVSNAYFLAEQRLAILTDTWALTTPANVRPDDRYDPSSRKPQPPPTERGPERDLHSQVHHVYTTVDPYRYLDRHAELFFKQAESGQLLSPDAKKQDDPRQPRLAIAPVNGGEPVEKIQQAKGAATYFNTEWRDWERDPYQQTYERRRAGYLGCKLGEGCE